MADTDVKHILIVDDEPDIISILEVIFKKTGNYKISSANDGKQALQMISADSSIDLILADVKMPEVDGIELVNKIKQINPEKPKVILITGFTDLPLDELYDLGVCGFISKPFEWEKIISIVNEALLPKPCYQKTFKKQDIKAAIEMELESIEAAQLYSEDFTLGRGGLFIQSPKDAFTGDLISFKISFLGGEIKNMIGVGQVVWYKRTDDGLNQLGIKFYNIEHEVETFIEKFCNKNKIKAFIPGR